MNYDLDSATHVLSRTPAALQALLGDAPNEWARGTEGPGTFSPFDVVGHLIDGEETDWIPRAQIIRARVAGVEFEAYDRFRHRSRNVTRTLDSRFWCRSICSISSKKSATLSGDGRITCPSANPDSRMNWCSASGRSTII